MFIVGFSLSALDCDFKWSNPLFLFFFLFLFLFFVSVSVFVCLFVLGCLFVCFPDKTISERARVGVKCHKSSYYHWMFQLFNLFQGLPWSFQHVSFVYGRVGTGQVGWAVGMSEFYGLWVWGRWFCNMLEWHFRGVRRLEYFWYIFYAILFNVLYVLVSVGWRSHTLRVTAILFFVFCFFCFCFVLFCFVLFCFFFASGS